MLHYLRTLLVTKSIGRDILSDGIVMDHIARIDNETKQSDDTRAIKSLCILFVLLLLDDSLLKKSGINDIDLFVNFIRRIVTFIRSAVIDSSN